jgi:PAS domain S-box-containing protein
MNTPVVMTELGHLMDEVASASTVDDVHRIGLRTIRKALDIERAALHRMVDGRMSFVADLGLSQAYKQAVDGYCPWDPDAGKFAPFLMEDVADAPELQELQELYRREEIGALAFVPLYYGARLLGQFSVYYTEPHEFSEYELALFGAAASYITFELEHRRIEGELQRRLAEERDARRELREGQERLHIALDAGQMGTWEWELGENRVMWSAELERLHGLEPGSFPGTFEGFQADMHPDDRDRVLASIKSTLESADGEYQEEYRIVRPDGEVRWVEARGRLVTDDDGDVTKMVGVCGDVTNRKRREQQLSFMSEASSLLSESLDSTELVKTLTRLTVPDLADWCVLHLTSDSGDLELAEVVHADPSKVELAWSFVERAPTPGGFQQILDSGESFFRPKIDPDILGQYARNDEHREVMQSLGFKSGIIVPICGRERAHGTLTLIASESGRTFTEDDLRFVEEFVARAALAMDNAELYATARRAVEVRDDVLAIVSHDLRNPLTVISTAHAVLERIDDEKQRANAMGGIKRAVDQMQKLIQDLLDASYLESGKLQLEPRPVNVSKLFAEMGELFAPRAEEQSVELSFDVEPDRLKVDADPTRLQQALGNLISNALRYVDEGGQVSVRATGKGDEVSITVADDGCGIPDDKLERLFDRFYQAQRDRHGGAGLGLAIAKGVVEAHGGELTVESTPAEGTTFEFTLPAVAEDE